MANLTLANDQITAEIAPLGAELQALRDRAGRDWLWDGDPAFWTGRAPLLFPMVGKAAGDRIKAKGGEYPLPQHGFARRMAFDVVEAQAEHCLMRLESNAATLAAYPYAFRLDVAYALEGAGLSVTATVFNRDEDDLPCAFGFHPAFRWPLPGAQGQHEARFDKDEPEPVRRLNGGLIEAQTYPSPVRNGRLALDYALFEHDAIVFDRLHSRRVTFAAPSGQSVEIDFPCMPDFGLWTKPGAPFLCLEPWQGFAAPEGFHGAFKDRPGVVAIAPGERRAFAITVRLAG